MSKDIPPLLSYHEAKARGYWFMSKRFGFGWVPISWQGWLTLLAFLVLAITEALRTIWSYYPTNEDVTQFAVVIILLVALLIIVCRRKGEEAHWRWGR